MGSVETHFCDQKHKKCCQKGAGAGGKGVEVLGPSLALWAKRNMHIGPHPIEAEKVDVTSPFLTPTHKERGKKASFFRH